MKKLLYGIDKVFFWALWSVALLILYYGYLQARIYAQVQDNQFIATEISKLDKVLGEVKELQRLKSQVIARVQIVQELSFSNVGHTAILGELTDISPAISLQRIEFEPGSLVLKGRFVAQTALIGFVRELEDFSYNPRPGKTYSYHLDYRVHNDRFSIDMKSNDASN